MTNKVLFLTGLFPEEMRPEIISNSKSNTQFAANNLQWSFVKGLIPYYNSLSVLSFPFLGSYPTLNKTPRIKQLSFGREMGFDGLSVSYFNFIALKNIDIYRKAKKRIADWALQNQGPKTLLIYQIYLPFLKAAIAAKKEFSDLKVIVIVPDLPIYMGGPNNALYRAFKRYTRGEAEKCYSQLDGYVLISKHMIEMLPSENKKWTVVEGIMPSDEIVESVEKKNKNDKKIIHYTGSLHSKSGILRLAEALKLINDKNIVLEICGDGNAVDELRLAAEADNRIVYKGSKVDRPEVLKLQREATLLVSPRTSEDIFTRFSFPSKVMEFLASGTPTLLYKLDGIPDEYYDYSYTLEDVSVAALAEKITAILNLDPEVLSEKGRLAREFILNNKNPVKQCEKVVRLIENEF
jgi:glycosyltransferase involved in cell wall biosynthesis